jgi:lysophospholipase L1-like esterase
VGPSSLRVSVSGKSGSVRQTIGGGANGTFKISGWVKSQGNVKAQVAVHAFAEGWKNNKFLQVQYFQNDNDWMKFEKEVQLPDWTSFFYVSLLAEGNGKVWLDEVGEAGKPVDQGRVQSMSEIMTTQAPAKDKPSVAGWGFYPQFPTAWQQTFNGQLERTKLGREKKDIHVVFIGDSLTQAWSDGNGGKEVWDKHYAPLGAANFGIGGDTTRQVLYRLQNGLVEGLSPKLVVLNIGTNNLYGDHNSGSDEEIADGIKAVVQELRKRLPDTKVLLLGVLPRENEYFSNRTKHINEIIPKLADGKNVRFLDMSARFQTEIGKVVPELYGKDQLHLVKNGYEMWANLMAPLFNEMMK